LTGENFDREFKKVGDRWGRRFGVFLGELLNCDGSTDIRLLNVDMETQGSPLRSLHHLIKNPTPFFVLHDNGCGKDPVSERCNV